MTAAAPSFVVSPSNTRSREETAAPSRAAAYDIARKLSSSRPGIAFTAYRVTGDGAYAIATYMNGEMTFESTED